MVGEICNQKPAAPNASNDFIINLVVVLFLIDSLAPFNREDDLAVDLIKKFEVPVLAVFTKIDHLSAKEKLLAIIGHYSALHTFTAYIPISAKTGNGLDVLREEIISRLPSGPAMFPKDYLTDQPERFLAAEVIREKVLHHTRQEVPHAVAVMIEQWEELPKLIRIAATIYVERAGQKAILIGAGGDLLKKVGTLARRDIEKHTGKKVFLQTFVKVRANWREDPEFLAASDWRNFVAN